LSAYSFLSSSRAVTSGINPIARRLVSESMCV
jgi:hypothetical protein